MTATLTSPEHSEARQAAEPPVIKCAELTKVFRDFWLRNRVRAVDKVDLSVQRGEVFGLLGPNGSGKSTTVKMILGLLHPTSGRIAVFGHHPRDVKMKQKLGYLPEESYLYPFLNARETLEYYAKLFHQNRRQRQQRIDMLLEMVGLDKVARRPIGEYSKGMQRRIGLAQALINDPEALILDEPTTGLDPIGTRQIKDLIRQLAERGKTVLLCSHLLADVEDVTDRVAIMFGGKVRQQGTIDQLLTESGVTSIQANDLSNEDVEVVEQALAQRHKYVDRVEHPRQKLESLFLQIVHEAQREGASTSGAGSGGRIAQFLVESESAHMPESSDSGAVLSQLMQDESSQQTSEGPQQQSGSEPASARQGDRPEAEGSSRPTPASSEDQRGQTDEASEQPTDQGVLDQLTAQDEDREPQASAAPSHEPRESGAPAASETEAAASASTAKRDETESTSQDAEADADADDADREAGTAANADRSVIDSLVDSPNESNEDDRSSKDHQ